MSKANEMTNLVDAVVMRICETERESWRCKNMKPIDGDTSMTHEYYKCEVCGRRMTLDYDEIS